MVESGHFEFFPACRLGAYEIVKVVGRGGMATVYEGRHVVLGRSAAIKVLHPGVPCDAVATVRLLQEGRVIASVRHPNIVEILDIGDHDGVPYLVMELLEGEDLGQYMRRRHPMPLAEVADCLLPVIEAVGVVHAAGIAHRDLKPGNIRMVRDGRGALVPKLLDFGISKGKRRDQDTDLTQTDAMLGTASYMAPEQVRSARDADASSDIYALGVILYECTTGERPFGGQSAYDRMHAVLTVAVTPPSVLRPELPQAFDALVLRAMRRQPSERFASADDLGRALARFASEPAEWLREFDPSAGNGARRALRPPAVIESGQVTLTLASAVPQVRKHGSRLATAAVACLAAAAGGLATNAASRARPSAPPPSCVEEVRSSPPQPIVPVVAADSDSTPAPSTAPVPPPVVSAPIPSRGTSAPAPARRETPALRVAPPARASQVPGAPPASRLSFGTNSAPIVE